MRRNVWILIGVGIGVSLLLAGVVSHYASSAPDGLNSVANDLGFGDTARDSAAGSSPLKGYEVTGIANERLAGGLAGVIGVLVTAALAFGLFLWLGRRGRAARSDAEGGSGAGADAGSEAGSEAGSDRVVGG